MQSAPREREEDAAVSGATTTAPQAHQAQRREQERGPRLRNGDAIAQEYGLTADAAMATALAWRGDRLDVIATADDHRYVLQIAVAGPQPDEVLTVMSDGVPVTVREIDCGHGGRVHVLDSPTGK